MKSILLLINLDKIPGIVGPEQPECETNFTLQCIHEELYHNTTWMKDGREVMVGQSNITSVALTNETSVYMCVVVLDNYVQISSNPKQITVMCKLFNGKW